MMFQQKAKKHTNANSNTYVPPKPRRNKRTKRIVDTQSISEFPVLGTNNSAEGSDITYDHMPVSYAGITREDECASTTTENDTSPGWVKLKMNKTSSGNKIKKKYGDQCVDADANADENINWGLTTSESNALTHMVNRWQSDRDLMNDYLDQTSPYWGMKHVNDPLSEDDLESESESDLSSEHSDDEDEDYDFL